MSANRDTFVASVKTADTTKINTVAAAITTYQTSIDAGKSVVGFREGFPAGYATFQADVNAANTAKLIALADAERVKQQTVEVARDLIRSQGEKPT